MTEALNRAPTGDSARGPGVDETPGPHPLTRRRPDSSTSAHATSQASWFRFPRFSKSADNTPQAASQEALVDPASRRAAADPPVCRRPTGYQGKGVSPEEIRDFVPGPLAGRLVVDGSDTVTPHPRQRLLDQLIRPDGGSPSERLGLMSDYARDVSSSSTKTRTRANPRQC